jgi:hypothetical protein
MKIEFKVGGDRTKVSTVEDKPAIYIVGVLIPLNGDRTFCPLLVGETSKLKTRMEQYVNPFEMPGREIYDLKGIKSTAAFQKIYEIIEVINRAPVKPAVKRIKYINDAKDIVELSKMIFFNHHSYIHNYYNSDSLTDFKKHGYLSLCKQLYTIKDEKNRNLIRIKKIIESKLRIIDDFYFLYHYTDSVKKEEILKDPHQYNNPEIKYKYVLTRRDDKQLARIRIESTTKNALEKNGIHTSAKNEAHIGRFEINLPKSSKIIFMDKIIEKKDTAPPYISFY